MGQCWQVPCRNSRCAHLSPSKMQSDSHCFVYPSEKASLQGSHKWLNINVSQACVVPSTLAGKKHSEGYWKTNENSSALGREQRNLESKQKKLLSVLFSTCGISGCLNENNMYWQHGLSAGMARGRAKPGCHAKQPHAPLISEICSSQGAEGHKNLLPHTFPTGSRLDPPN